MKLRTLGRHHAILHHLRDEGLKTREELGPGIGSMDAHALQTLLELGLVERIPLDTNKQGWYIITSAGLKAYKLLQSTQPWNDQILGKGYKKVDVECPLSKHWMAHFLRRIW